MTIMKLILFCCTLLLVAGCAPKTRYTWNDYDNKLYQHYKNPAEYDEFVEHLREVIEESEQEGKVPPGIYAEYGFALYEKGNFSEAAKYFKLENDKWPESRVLMAKMIQNAQMRSKHGNKSGKSSVPSNAEPPTATVSGEKEISK